MGIIYLKVLRYKTVVISIAYFKTDAETYPMHKEP